MPHTFRTWIFAQTKTYLQKWKTEGHNIMKFAVVICSGGEKQSRFIAQQVLWPVHSSVQIKNKLKGTAFTPTLTTQILLFFPLQVSIYTRIWITFALYTIEKPAIQLVPRGQVELSHKSPVARLKCFWDALLQVRSGCWELGWEEGTDRGRGLKIWRGGQRREWDSHSSY